jgi:hypothetical protein
MLGIFGNPKWRKWEQELRVHYAVKMTPCFAERNATFDLKRLLLAQAAHVQKTEMLVLLHFHGGTKIAAVDIKTFIQSLIFLIAQFF